MKIDSIGSYGSNNVNQTSQPESTLPVDETITPVMVKKSQNSDSTQQQGTEDDSQNSNKQPSQSTIGSVMSEVNQKIKPMRTRCEYSYDEPTKRVSIKVYDDDTDKLIREVPPEESLKMLQRVWELAGIMVDEKR